MYHKYITKARNDHQVYYGKYKYNNDSLHTEHGPLESCNKGYYSKSTNNGLYKNNKIYSHIKTSSYEGKDFGKVKKLWEKLATSESKLEMMGRMVKNRVGFNEIEDFANKIERKITENERQHRRGGNRRSQRIIETTMTIKLQDERRKHARLLKEKNEVMRTIIENSEGDRDRVRKVMRKLRKVSKRKKKELRETQSIAIIKILFINL